MWRYGLVAFMVIIFSTRSEELARMLVVPQATSQVIVDGKLDEAAWKGSAARDLLQIGGLPPLHPVRGRVLWDKDGLYIGFECNDWDLLSAYSERDAHLWEEGDVFEIFLANVGSGAAFERIELEINPNNAFLDIRHRAGDDLDTRIKWNWEGARWAVSNDGSLNDFVRDNGWSGELFLPWAGIRELGAPLPTDGNDDWRLLLYTVNRIQLAEKWLSRAKAFWPAQSSERVNQMNEFAILKLVAGRTGQTVEGYQEVIQGVSERGDPIFHDYRGKSLFWEFWTAKQDAALTWNTAPVPAQPGTTVSFGFVGQALQAGGRKNLDRATFTLWVNGRAALDFEPYHDSDQAWQQGDRRLVFQFRDSDRQPNGYYALTVPAEWVTPGQPAELKLTWKGDGPDTRFDLKTYTDAVLFEEVMKPTGPAAE